MYCSACGAPTTPDDRFCGACGTAVAPVGPVGEAVRNGVPFALLVVLVALAGLIVGGGVGLLVVG